MRKIFFDRVNVRTSESVSEIRLISVRNTINLLVWFLAHVEFGYLEVWDFYLSQLHLQVSLFF